MQIGQVLAHSQILCSLFGFLLVALLCVAFLLLLDELLDLVHVLVYACARVGDRLHFGVLVDADAVQQVLWILLSPQAGVVEGI